jgi:hypothetical protein
MKILLGDFNATVRREDIVKPTIGNESLHEISNDNVVRVVNFATSKKLTIKLTTFGQTGDNIQVYLMSDLSGQQITILTITCWRQRLGKGWQ